MIWCLPYTICLILKYIHIYIYILANEEIPGNRCALLQSIFNFTFHQLSQLFFLFSTFFCRFCLFDCDMEFFVRWAFFAFIALVSLYLSLALLKFVFMEALGIVVLGLIDKDILVASVAVDRVVSFARHSASASVSGLVNFNVFAFVLFCCHHIFLSLSLCVRVCWWKLCIFLALSLVLFSLIEFEGHLLSFHCNFSFDPLPCVCGCVCVISYLPIWYVWNECLFACLAAWLPGCAVNLLWNCHFVASMAACNAAYE